MARTDRRIGWVDLLLMLGLLGLFVGLFDFGRGWTGAHRATVEIDLSPAALPRYTFYSLSRGLIAYAFSLLFTLLYGYWAAKDKIAERVLVPLLDILQSIPVLGFMPGLVLALVTLFPHSNIGLELACILMIFTGQVWNMTFSFFHSLRSVPTDMREVDTVYRFNWWQRFKWVELPFATMGLVWNSMMSMAGGWFFLATIESFQLGDADFRLPGIGAYMSVAVDKGDVPAMIYAIIAMTVMIVVVDQLLWRPIVVWAQKFRVEEGGSQEAMSSWFLDWLVRSKLLRAIRETIRNRRASASALSDPPKPVGPTTDPVHSAVWLARVLLGLLVVGLAYGGWRLFLLLVEVNPNEWGQLIGAAFVTLGRVLVSTLLGTLWALPAGLAIGLSPRLSRILQPVVQVAASFPAPMLFPIVIGVLQLLGVSLGWGSILLMLLGTQWYILFNVIAGAMAIPADLKEATRSYRFGTSQRFWILYLPAVFPYLVTGWVTAAGGAWNASIVAEIVTFKGETLRAIGLGAEISLAAKDKNLPVLTASILVMSALVVMFNRIVWRRLYDLAERRYSLNK